MAKICYLKSALFVSCLVLLLFPDNGGMAEPLKEVSGIKYEQRDIWKKTQEKRRNALFKACDSIFGFNPTNSTKPTKEFFLTQEAIHLMSDKLKMRYCPIGKIGITNFKQLLAIETMGRNFHPLHIGEDPHTPSYLHRNQIKGILELDESRIKEILEDYKGFIFVRDPLERLLSAFRDKFEHTGLEGDWYRKIIGSKIIRYYRENPSLDSIQTGKDISFEEFVKFVIDDITEDKVGKYVNFHWIPISVACRPCHIRYDIIGTMGTYDDDVGHIFSPRTVKTLDKITAGFTQRESNRSSINYFDKYYDQVSKLDKQRLYDIYKLDYQLFGFKPPFDFLKV